MKATAADAIGFALTDLGVDTATNVPGFGVSETFQSYCKAKMKRSVISFHEEAAFSIAHGASMVGKRSAVLMKAHGFVKAGNSAVNSLYTNITAGFACFIFEDFTGAYSDNIMELTPILRGMHFPTKIGKVESIYDDIINCYRESEQRKMPYVFLINSADIMKYTEFERREDLKKNFEFKRDLLGNVIHPLLAGYQYKVFTAKKITGDFSNIQTPQIPVYPKDFPQRYLESANKYVTFFDTFKSVRGSVVTGDTSVSSCFAFPPYNSIDLITHLGGSIPLAIGAYKAGHKDVWALSGDFGFLAAGHMSLIEILEREIPLKIVIFYNKQAAATGGQIIHKKIMYRVLAGYNNFIKHISDPQNPFEVNEVLEEANSAEELRIVMVDY
ncbi:acetolactate synthase 1 catalytic subunit [bacterium BMS3Abin04]|nr:acetolactate synthase 1 catalytic subunit [bacterium BMS3Abin04]